jgi:hypothetical protein
VDDHALYQGAHPYPDGVDPLDLLEHHNMKNAHRQSASFRRAFWAEQAREAYVLAKRGGEFESLAFDRWEPEDLSQYVPEPSPEGWTGLGA